MAACLCCRTTALIEACCQVDCGINANGLDEHHEEYLIKYSAVLLRQRAVDTPCRCGSGAGIYSILFEFKLRGIISRFLMQIKIGFKFISENLSLSQTS